MVNVVCPSRYKISRPKLRSEIDRLLQQQGISTNYDLNIIFVGRTKMKSIASKYKKESVALPVLSFPFDRQKDNLLGEIFICYPQAVLLAAQRNKTVDQTIFSLIEHGLENIIR